MLTMKTAYMEYPETVTHARRLGRGGVADGGGAGTASTTMPSAVIRRLRRVAELAPMVPGLSGTTRATILRRVKDALGADSNHHDVSLGHTTEVRREPCKEGHTAHSLNPARSHHERLERLERSVADVRQAFKEIHRLARKACGSVDG